MDILPTFACFDDALELVAELVKETPARARDGSVTLVHGIAHSDVGEPYAHAWVEDGAGLCWDAGLVDGQRIYYAVKRDEFYAARGLQRMTRYTVEAACLLNMATRHYGPWLPEYRALCAPRRRVMGRVQATINPSADCA